MDNKKQNGVRRNIYFKSDSDYILNELSKEYKLTFSALIKLLLVNESKHRHLKKVLDDLELYKWLNVGKLKMHTALIIHFGVILELVLMNIYISFLVLNMDIKEATLLDIITPLHHIINSEVKESTLDIPNSDELSNLTIENKNNHKGKTNEQWTSWDWIKITS